MCKQFVFFYMMKNKPGKVVGIVPEHIKYWEDHRPINYSGGPFSDRSGGLIIFETENIKTAMDLVMNDPFIENELIEEKWVKEWMRE